MEEITITFALKFTVPAGTTVEQFVEDKNNLEPLYATLDAYQKAHPELEDFNMESAR